MNKLDINQLAINAADDVIFQKFGTHEIKPNSDAFLVWTEIFYKVFIGLTRGDHKY